MGAPTDLARGAQTMVRLGIEAAIRSLENHVFEFEQNGHLIRHEPIGVCSLITLGIGRSIRSSPS